MSGAATKPRSSKRAPRQENASVPAAAAQPLAASGFAPERLAFLLSLRDKVNSGFYNTEPVLDDLSHSFTKAVDALV